MEEYLPLANQNEIDEWNGFIQSRETIEQYQYDIEEFKERIEEFIYLAEVSSNRSMEAENYTIDTVNTISGAFGIVRFSFNWTNFSITDSNKILIGDVFSEGMILSSDNVDDEELIEQILKKSGGQEYHTEICKTKRSLEI